MEESYSSRSEANISDEEENGDDTARDSPAEPSFKFRNYTPQTHFLDGHYTIEKTEPGSIQHYVRDKLDIITDEIDSIDESNKYRIDPQLLEPKKIDWDLKRRIEKRLDRLERRTTRQIAVYIKSQRIKK